MSAPGIGRHPARECLPRHRHADPYAAVVLAGGYVEAGENGRIVAAPGTVIVHDPFGAHRDIFGDCGAQVLNLAVASGLQSGVWEIDDPDAVVRLAERNPGAASALVAEKARRGGQRLDDWPDRLAAMLRVDPAQSIADWADAQGLHPASVSRGFARAYGVSPKRFRHEARVRRAIDLLADWDESLAALAAETGFADQAHLARSVRDIAGAAPIMLRAKCVQAVPQGCC